MRLVYDRIEYGCGDADVIFHDTDCGFRVSWCVLRVTGCELQVTGCVFLVTGYGVRVAERNFNLCIPTSESSIVGVACGHDLIRQLSILFAATSRSHNL